MAQVPKELIEEATRRGIVEGVTIACSDNQSHGIVSPIDEWHSYDSGTLVVGTDDAGDWLCAKWQKNAWATVITPAPSKGLQEGDSVECSPAMRAAIIELAKELGFQMTVNAEICHSTGIGLSWKYSQVNRWNFRGENNPITPEEFIARMRVTASTKANKDCSFRLSYEKGAVKIGDVLLSNDVYRSIAKGLQD